MKVLILGATGFIGLPVAQALIRGGHTVYGLARTENKAKLLAAEEIIPVIGDVNSDAWLSLIPTLDCIIDTIGGMEIQVLAAAAFERVTKTIRDIRSASAPPLSYIYTSGTWVHGDNRKITVTDTTPISEPVELVKWRPAVEQAIIQSPLVNGIVIRPGLLYGRSGSIIGMIFHSASQGKVSWPGTPGGRCAVIHVDDLADLYLRAAEKGSLIGGKIFDASNPTTESVDEFLQKLVEISGVKGYEYRKPGNLFEEALASSALIRPYLANALLGWSAKKPSLTQGLETYYAAWHATIAV
ncbi:hypothetical protein C8J57DRAFT_1164244 [Mycena rebaudengoi]|nr:hypothetical protein C8J57DRAFT_1164244 [Mycena rebaudengoi]